MSFIKFIIYIDSTDPIISRLKYSSVEIFYGAKPGIRINGNVGTELMMQLTNSVTGKIVQDNRGW